MPNILLCSVGRRVEMVRCFRDAFQRLGMFGSIVGSDIDWLAPAFQEVDETRILPRFTEDGYLPALLELCKDQSIDAIFPFHDGELAYLAKHREAIEATGARVYVVPSAAVEICGDKRATVEFFRRLGLPTTASWLPEEIVASELEYPLFIKPRDGSAAKNTFRINNQAELEFFSGYVGNPIIQEFLPGPEITSDVICDLQGNVLAIVSRQRIAVRGGEAIKSVTIQDDRIDQACHEIAAQLPACGPITVQCMMKDGVPHFIEINARLGGGVPLAIAAGVDVCGLLLSDVGGLSLDGIEREAQLGIFMTRCDESFFLTESASGSPSGRHLRS